MYMPRAPETFEEFDEYDSEGKIPDEQREMILDDLEYKASQGLIPERKKPTEQETTAVQPKKSPHEDRGGRYDERNSPNAAAAAEGNGQQAKKSPHDDRGGRYDERNIAPDQRTAPEKPPKPSNAVYAKAFEQLKKQQTGQKGGGGGGSDNRDRNEPHDDKPPKGKPR